MRTDFTDDPQGYARSRARLVGRVLEYLSDILEPDPALIETVFDFKFHRDGRLGFWRRADIAAFADDWIAELPQPPAADATLLTSLGLVLRWLQADKLLDRGSDSIKALLLQIDDEIDALDDDDDDGDDDISDYPDDDLDDPLVGGWPDFADDPDDPDNATEQPVFAPVVLPSTAELIAAAEASPMLRQIQALLGWLHDGKPLLTNKRLRPADLQSLASEMGLAAEYAAGTAGRQVTLALEWARVADLVRTVKGRLLPVKATSSLRRQPVELWERLFTRFDYLGPHFASRAGREPGEGEFAEGFDEIWAGILMALYDNPTAPVPLEAINQMADEAMRFLDQSIGRIHLPEAYPMARRGIKEALHALGRLGAVESTVAGGELREVIAAIAGTDKPDLELVNLTPIGLWAAHRWLAAGGADVIEVRQLVDRSATEVAQRLGAASADMAEVGWAAWVDARGESAAADELERALREADTSAVRLALLAGLPATGSAGVRAGLRLRSAGGLTGAVVTGFLVEQGVIGESAVSRAEAALALADVLSVAADDEMLIETVSEGSVPGQIELIRGIARSGHPQALHLLDEIAGNHPDRTVARVAGKERLRLRSAGAG